MKRFLVEIGKHSPIDKYGKQSLTTHVIYPDGRETYQGYYANADEVVKRLRHNIADQYRFEKYRKRLAASA
jgi:hypothetical protein